MALDSVLDSLPSKLAGVPSAQMMQPIIDELAAASGDGTMRGRIAAMAAARNRSEMDDKVLNVMAAGALAVLPGGDSLKPVLEPIYGWRVNSFLASLRTAIVNSKPLERMRKERSTQFIFYPEFYTEFPDSVDKRIAAVARAHAGLGPSSPELPALYTLGGRFDGGTVKTLLKALGGGGGGTTCVMTARAVYHAAGCDMIDGSEPTINTPNGPVLDLGTPTKKTAMVQNAQKQWVQKTTMSAKRIRADIADDGKAFKDNDITQRPHLTIGDIYYVEGTGDHLYLARGAGALAVHVGIVVAHSGDTYLTVDGGWGTGAEVHLSKVRQLTFKKNAGWTFADVTDKGGLSYADVTKSYNESEVQKVKNAANDLTTDEGIAARIKSDKRFAGFKQSFEKAIADYNGSIGTARQPIYFKTLNMVRENVRRLARVICGGEVGEVRTIHGWWESESYNQLAWAGPKEISTLMR